ncbi:MAG: ankyrin repeat domain-containing protein [Aestuariibacter sp.]|nr:ankyrin repeat domain-containing protein [Aestuariibacter sp.]
MDSLATQPEAPAQFEQSEYGQDEEEEGSSCLLDASLLRAVTSLKAAAAGLFVSGWDNDTDDNDEDEMETDDNECATLRPAEYGDMAALRKLLDEDVRLVHTRDSDGYTPMHRASKNEHPDAVREPRTVEARCGRGRAHREWVDAAALGGCVHQRREEGVARG